MLLDIKDAVNTSLKRNTAKPGPMERGDMLMACVRLIQKATTKQLSSGTK